MFVYVLSGTGDQYTPATVFGSLKKAYNTALQYADGSTMLPLADVKEAIKNAPYDNFEVGLLGYDTDGQLCIQRCEVQ